MRTRILSILLFLALLLATPAGPGKAQAQQQGATGASEETSAATEEELKEFVPTEEVAADSAISFPVDI